MVLCWAFAILIDVEGVGKLFFVGFCTGHTYHWWLGTPITYPRGLIKGWLIYTRHFRAGPAGTPAAGCPQGEYIYLELVKYLNFNKMSFHPEWGRACRVLARKISGFQSEAELYHVVAPLLFWLLKLKFCPGHTILTPRTPGTPSLKTDGIITGAYNGTNTKMNFCTQYAEIRDTHTV